MKTSTITAVLGALAALPFIFSRRTSDLIPVKPDRNSNEREANLRYDVDDFVTQQVNYLGD